MRHGADLIGLVSEMPSGPGVIPEEDITAIAPSVPPGVTSVLLTSRREAAAIIEQQQRTRVQAIQLVDHVPADQLQALRQKLPGIRLIQVVHVTGEKALDAAVLVSAQVDAILLDSGNPRAQRKTLGGTGRTHDWEISRRIVEAANLPVFLAGGLAPENVSEAVRRVKPFGVDVCSGVRTDGRLDEEKLTAFVQAVRQR